VTSRRFAISANAETQQSYLREKGDASGSVRAEVLVSLREFQDGYAKRDLLRLDEFMNRLFPRDQDARVIGTDANEWKSGYDAIARFVRDDWRGWGDVYLAVDDAVISSSGDAAWLATTGRVTSLHSTRSIRFTAVLTRRDGHWLFRQIQFQWDERLLAFSDLLGTRGWSPLKLR
jgi:hypothetical protein